MNTKPETQKKNQKPESYSHQINKNNKIKLVKMKTSNMRIRK